MGWGGSLENGGEKVSRPSSRLSLMSRNSSEASLDMGLFRNDTDDEDQNDDNFAIDAHRPR